jgi:hypothetical protein
MVIARSAVTKHPTAPLPEALASGYGQGSDVRHEVAASRPLLAMTLV